METILLTGATGFVGSALAANFLAESANVIALVRNDADGERTRTAVRTAADGFGIKLPNIALRRHLHVLQADDDRYVAQLTARRLAEVTLVWHVAAEMNMAMKNLARIFATNVGMTADLYRHVSAHAPACRRFHYMSTAYVVGMDGGDVDETLHFGGHCINPYQVSKRCAEHSLALLSSGSRLPVTLFRPTIIVGHLATGWTVRNGFGMYMFVEAMKAIAASKQASFNLPLVGTSRPDFMPVDRLVAQAMLLTNRREETSGLEIFNCSGGRGLSLGDAVARIGRLCGVDVHYAAPETELEQTMAAGMEGRLPFANTDWQFSRSNLDKAIGRTRADRPVDEKDLERLVGWYLET